MSDLQNTLYNLFHLLSEEQLKTVAETALDVCGERGINIKLGENGAEISAEKSAELFPELSRAHAIVDNNKNKGTLYDNKNKKKENGQKKEKESCGAINPDLFFQFFNKTIAEAGSLIPKVTKKTDIRSRTVSARAREFGNDALRTVVEKAAKSDFLNGKNDRSWVATIDWLLRPTVFPKVLDGNYDNRKINNNGNSNRQQDYDRRRGWDAEETNPDDFAKGYRG